MKLTKEEYIKFLETQKYINEELILALKEYAKYIGYRDLLKDLDKYSDYTYIEDMTLEAINFTTYNEHQSVPVDFVFNRPEWEDRVKREKDEAERKLEEELQQQLQQEKIKKEEDDIACLKKLMKKYPHLVK